MAQTKQPKKKSTRIPKPRILVPGKDYDLNLPKGHLSFSQISTYLKCPMQYWYKYIKNCWSPVSAAVVEGTIWSKLCEETNRNFIDVGQHVSVNAAICIYNIVLQRLIKTIDDWGDTSEIEIRERGHNFIKKCWIHDGTKDRVPDWEPEAAEHEVTIVLAGVPVVCIADMVESRTVTDFKVASSTRYYNPDKSLQLDLYSVAYGKENVRYLVCNKKTGRVESLPSERDLKHTKKQLEIMVSNVAFAISAGSFPPCNRAENFLCSEKWCAFHRKCKGS